MAGYEAPFTAPDISPGAAMIAAVLRSNRENDRADEYLGLQREAMQRSAERESADEVRRRTEDEYKKRKEAFEALPALQRAATKSIGMANANPYGIKFEEQEQPGPSLRDSGINVMGDTDYGAHARAMLGQAEQPPAPKTTLEPGMEGPEQDPAAEAARFAQPEERPMLGPEAPTGVEAAQALLGQPHGRKLYATMAGSRFEVPEMTEKTAFGADYDAIYGNLIDQGIKPTDAMKLVAAQYKTDQTQKHIGERLESGQTFKNQNREDQQTFQREENEKYKRTFDQAMQLAEKAGQYKVAASAPGLKQESANDRAMSLLERAGAGVRQTSQFNKLAASDKTVRTIMVNIANGTTPLQHKDAQIQLARFFRQAQPTEGEMHILYNNLGGTMDKWNQFVAKMETGDLSSEQLRQMRVSAVAVKKEHEEDLRRFQNVAKARLGPGGGFDLLPDQAQRLYESMGAELGLDNLPPLYQTEGGITVGSGKAPSVRPRGTKKTALDELESQLDAMGSK